MSDHIRYSIWSYLIQCLTIFYKLSYHIWYSVRPYLIQCLTIFDTLSDHIWYSVWPFLIQCLTIFDTVSDHVYTLFFFFVGICIKQPTQLKQVTQCIPTQTTDTSVPYFIILLFNSNFSPQDKTDIQYISHRAEISTTIDDISDIWIITHLFTFLYCLLNPKCGFCWTDNRTQTN